MVRYRVTYTVNEMFNCNFRQVEIIEADVAISRKEIASRLNISINDILEIEIL